MMAMFRTSARRILVVPAGTLGEMVDMRWAIGGGNRRRLRKFKDPQFYHDSCWAGTAEFCGVWVCGGSLGEGARSSSSLGKRGVLRALFLRVASEIVLVLGVRGVLHRSAWAVAAQVECPNEFRFRTEVGVPYFGCRTLEYCSATCCIGTAGAA